MKNQIIPILIALLLLSCAGRSAKEGGDNGSLEEVKLQYARGFKVEKGQGFVKLSVINPWEKGEIYAVYYLCKESAVALPTDGIRVDIPLKRVALGSATQFEFVDLLDQMGEVCGVCDAKRIYSPKVLARLTAGEAIDLGDPFQLDYERVLTLKPSAIMMSGYGSVDEYSRRVKQMGISVIYNNEWMETSLLARAEWIKFVGHLFDKEQQADSLFNLMALRYEEVKTELSKSIDSPSVLAGDNFRGTWYMPGGESFMGNLFKEAGGDYYYENDGSRGSLPSDFESALHHFHKADVWLGADAHSLEQLAQNNERNKLFQAYRTRRVFGYNARVNGSGGNDYWESAVARPDVLLADFAKAIHPELLPNHTLYYLKQLK